MIGGYLQGASVLGPGLPGWQESQDILTGAAPYEWRDLEVTPPAMLPPNERRRSVYTVRLALAPATEVMESTGVEAEGILSVFASSLGDGNVMNKMCLTLAERPESISPTIFHNSVHNAPSGYYSIAKKAMGSTLSVAGHDATFTVGLIEALTSVTLRKKSVMLVAYDMVLPHPLCENQLFVDPFATALLFSHDQVNSAPRVTLSVDETPNKVNAMNDAGLERLRAGNPAAASLPLLSLYARHEKGSVTAGYVNRQTVTISVE